MKCLKVSSKGQVVLPVKIRKQLDIHKGSRFKIEVQGSKIILTPY
ncbi:MAG: AbrB/MazE/SpoVT family DNA-binding domain-containing protein [Actinomycetota bacterium]